MHLRIKQIKCRRASKITSALKSEALMHSMLRHPNNIFVHIHECLVCLQAVFQSIKLVSIITAYIL
jgi:hypothetical protein